MHRKQLFGDEVIVIHGTFNRFYILWPISFFFLTPAIRHDVIRNCSNFWKNRVFVS